MLGSRHEAQDVLQNAWIRWQAVPAPVDNPGALLATIVTRLCLTELDSARVRRETYVGPWLPEPVATDSDPLLGAENSEALSMAVLLLLERLSPAERAAYVLHEAFDYPFRQIAEVLETSEANARQLGTRARAHIDRERKTVVSGAERERLLAAFIAAAQSGDLETLESVLAEDVMALSDGGGVVQAARKPVVGRDRVARFLLGVLEKFASDLRPQPFTANGEIGVRGVRDDGFEVFWTADFTAHGVSRIYIVMNPEKVAGLTASQS
jgi:RNA polymerase sigma-70 factor (ECF subfamily)